MRITLTPDIRKTLRDEKDRTNVGAKKLLSLMHNPPKELTPYVITNWFRGAIKTADKRHIQKALETWRSLPTCQNKAKSDPSKHGAHKRLGLVLTDAKIRALQKEKSRTNVGSTNLLKHIENPPENLNPLIIDSWLRGDTKTASPELYKLVLNAWKSLPTGYRVELTEDMRRALFKAKADSGLGAIAIYDCLPDYPADLQARTIENWMNGLVQTVYIEQYNLVLQTWKNAARTPYLSYGPITFRALLTKTGLPSGVFIKECLNHPDKPDALDEKALYARLTKKIVSHKGTFTDFLMGVFEEVFPPGDMIEITDKIKQQLRAEEKRTGISPAEVLGDEYSYISKKMIKGWINGQIPQANKHHVDIVLQRCKETISHKPVTAPVKRVQCPITDNMYEELVSYKNRSGLGPSRIMAYMKTNDLFSEGHNITQSRIESWLSRIAKTASMQDFYDVMSAYEKVLKESPASLDGKRTLLTPDFVDRLNTALKDRRNFSRTLFIKRGNPPSSLTLSKFDKILSGTLKTISLAEKEFLEKALLKREQS